MTTFKAKHKETGEVMKVHCSNNKKDATPYFDGTWMSESDFNQLYTRIESEGNAHTDEVLFNLQKNVFAPWIKEQIDGSDEAAQREPSAICIAGSNYGCLCDKCRAKIKAGMESEKPASVAGKDDYSQYEYENDLMTILQVKKKIKTLLTAIEAEVEGRRNDMSRIPKRDPEMRYCAEIENALLDDILAIISKYKN